MDPERMPRHLVVVAGGTGERLGRVDKALCRVGGGRLIDRALSLPVPGRRVVVRPAERAAVGNAPDGRPVETVSEAPAGAGPAAGLAAGVAALITSSPFGVLDGPIVPDGIAPDELVAVLAADHLGPVDEVVVRLAGELIRHPGNGVAVAAPGGDAQWLTAVWRTRAVIEALAALGDPRDAAVRRLVALGAPLMVDVPRIPSLDRLDDLVDPPGGFHRLGISGREPQRTALGSRLLAADGWRRDEGGGGAVDPAGRSAIRLRRRERTDADGDELTNVEPVVWIVVAPPGTPTPDWAVASLVPLE